MSRLLLLGLLILPIAAGTSAAAMGKGTSVLAIQLTEGDGDFVTYEGGLGEISHRRHSDMGVQGQYFYMWNDDYTVTVGAGIGFARETDNPGVNGLVGQPSVREFFRSWQFRVGSDRVGKLNDRFHVHAGPGFQVWGGNSELQRGTTVLKSATSLRLALDGRIGVMLNWGESFGMAGQVGHYWGYASAKDAGAEAKFTPSGANAAMGVFFSF